MGLNVLKHGTLNVYYVCSVQRASRHAFSTFKSRREPLSILFCGSDDFSVVSLNALHAESKQNRSCIASLDVVCRPPKPTGRGLKKIREVPIAGAARELGLPVHQIDTFRGWQPPQPSGLPIDLVVAVSFGLLVPPRILGATKYGGLNVHPSLLPDLRGPAPLHHTLLQRRARTGVTVQTLHPKHFDQGLIIAQTPQPGFEHHCGNVPDLLQVTAREGAALLLESIREGHFASHEGASASVPTEALRTAPKIRPEDRHVNWTTWTAEEIMLRNRVIGPLWNNLSSTHGVTRRVLWSSGFEYDKRDAPVALQAGKTYIIARVGERAASCIKTCDGKELQIDQVTFGGQSMGNPIPSSQRAGCFDGAEIADAQATGEASTLKILWQGYLT